jgi:hypothetical protein
VKKYLQGASRGDTAESWSCVQKLSFHICGNWKVLLHIKQIHKCLNPENTKESFGLWEGKLYSGTRLKKITY